MKPFSRCEAPGKIPESLSYTTGPAFKNLYPKKELFFMEISKYLTGISTNITSIKLIVSVALKAPKAKPPILSTKDKASGAPNLNINFLSIAKKNISIEARIRKLSNLEIDSDIGVNTFMRYPM